jgi:hypothetical protein
MNTSTDSYHNFLITGGPTFDDLPSTKEEALDEFEGNIIAVCEEIGQPYTVQFMEHTTLYNLINLWRASDVGDALLISEVGWSPKTTTVLRDGGAGDITNLMKQLSAIADLTTRQGRAPVISIVYSQDTNSN